MVVVYHVFSHRILIARDPDHVTWLKDGVAIFFVISGFVMARSAEREPFRPATFFRRRLLRVVPLYWFVTFWYVLMTRQWDWPHLFHTLLFLPEADSAGAVRLPVIDVGWTLNYEMAFYGLFALSMLLPRRLALSVLCAILALLAILGSLVDAGPLADYYFLPYWWEFIAGMLIARLNLRAPAWTLPLGFLWLAVGPQLFDARLLETSLAAALIVASARSLDGVLRPWSFPMLLGDASYAIYLTHLFVMFALYNSFGSLGHPAAMLPLAVIGSLIIGIGAHLFVEKPLAELVRYHRKRSPSMSSAALNP